MEVTTDIVTIDTETSISEERGPMPQYHKNFIAALGITDNTNAQAATFYSNKGTIDYVRALKAYVKARTDRVFPYILQGHNIKFDILYLMKDDPYFLRDLVKAGVLLWDTMIAEYLLSAQSTKSVKLNDLIIKYAGSQYLKDSYISDLFEQGIGADKIDEKKLLAYLSNDIHMTALVGANQRTEIRKQGMNALATTQMDALAAIIEMEYNGMHVDMFKLMNMSKLYRDALDKVEIQLRLFIDATLSPQTATLITTELLGNKTLSAIMYGGVLQKAYQKQAVDKDGNPRYYKSGPRKGQPVITNVKEDVRVEPAISDQLAKKIALIHETSAPGLDDDHLQYIIDNEMSGYESIQYATLIQEYRKYSKMLGTYLKPISDKVLGNSILHGSINQTITATGRTSSSSPNLQNIPSADDNPLKRVFTSRFIEGFIVEVDYKQLEVIALALLSQCPDLIAAIKAGEDIHNITGAQVYKTGMSHDQRRTIKSVNFGLIYGGGAKGIAAANNLSVSLVKQIIAAFYHSFPGVEKWHKAYASFVNQSTVQYQTGKIRDDGKPEHAIQVSQPTGRKLEYICYPNTSLWARGQPDSPSSTQMKNYPVQSLATGDIVPMMVGVLLKAIIANDLYDDVKLINTIHDSVLLDVESTAMEKAIPMIKNIMERVPEYLHKNFGIETDLPFRVEIKAGPNWKDMTEFK